MSKKIFIVVEGPDASGKTSIAKELANKINALYFERTLDLRADTTKKHPIEYYESLGRKLSSQIKKELDKSSVVIARYVYSISAIFYADTCKIRPVITGVIKPDYIIYCYADSKTLIERLKRRSENGEPRSYIEKDPKKYKRLCRRYEDLFKNGDNVIKVNTSNKKLNKSVSKILRLLNLN